jgi:hypothetical protein
MKNDTNSQQIGTQQEAAGLHMTALPVDQNIPIPSKAIDVDHAPLARGTVAV